MAAASLLAAATLPMSGCSHHQFYGPLVRRAGPRADSGLPGHSLLAVQFTDQGAFYRREDREASMTSLHEHLGCGTLVVAFAHGWHHNADPRDEHLRDFERKFLARLSNDRNVIGVYIGWRGETSRLPVLNRLTFFGTKDAAETVGYGGVTELMVRIRAAVEAKNAACTAQHVAPAQLLVVGHSLGGLVIYSALSQLLIERFLAAGEPEAFGDLVVLVNPAFEASRFRILQELSVLRQPYRPNQRPVLLIAQSEADSATGMAFPLGRSVAKMFEDVPSSPYHADAVALSRTAIGQYAPYRTHCIVPDVARPGEEAPSAGCPATCEYPFPSGSARLCPLPGAIPRDPIVVARVSSSLMGNHNDVWNDGFTCFLLDYVAWSLRLGKGSSTPSPSLCRLGPPVAQEALPPAPPPVQVAPEPPETETGG